MTDANGTVPVEPKAEDLVIQFEESGNFRAAPGQDPAGNWEIGYGSIWDWRNDPPTRVTAATSPVDEAMARSFLFCELGKAALDIQADVHLKLTANETAAIEDFIYNLGVGNFRSSTLLRKLNAGDFAGAAAEFDRWDHAGGRVMAGLLRRRQAETALFKTPDTA